MKFLQLNMSNFFFLDNGRMYQIFMFQTSKKKSKLKILHLESYEKRPTHIFAPQHTNFCKDTVCLLTLKCLFFKKISCFLYSYTKFLMFLWQWNIMEFYNYIKKLPLPKKQYLLCVHSWLTKFSTIQHPN